MARVTLDEPPPGVTIYPTAAATWARIETLKKQGIWPGAVQVRGGWYLTVDPPVAELDAHGYQAGG